MKQIRLRLMQREDMRGTPVKIFHNEELTIANWHDVGPRQF